MRRHLVRHARVDAGRPTPHFDEIVAGSQILCAPHRGMVANMGAGINVGRLDVLADNTDFVSVHGKPIQIDRFPNSVQERAVKLVPPDRGNMPRTRTCKTPPIKNIPQQTPDRLQQVCVDKSTRAGTVVDPLSTRNGCAG